MYKLLIFLLFNNIIRAEIEAKYIDLLPEKEKEEFLDKIARRILADVQTRDDKFRVSGELTDDQLDIHDEYVKRILREESQNLRKHSDTNDPDISVIAIDMKDIGSEDRRIDLTLRTDHNDTENKKARRVFTGYSINENAESDYQDKDYKISIGNENVVNIQDVKSDNQTQDVADGNVPDAEILGDTMQIYAENMTIPGENIGETGQIKSIDNVNQDNIEDNKAPEKENQEDVQDATFDSEKNADDTTKSIKHESELDIQIKHFETKKAEVQEPTTENTINDFIDIENVGRTGIISDNSTDELDQLETPTVTTSIEGNEKTTNCDKFSEEKSDNIVVSNHTAISVGNTVSSKSVASEATENNTLSTIIDTSTHKIRSTTKALAIENIKTRFPRSYNESILLRSENPTENVNESIEQIKDSTIINIDIDTTINNENNNRDISVKMASDFSDTEHINTTQNTIKNHGVTITKIINKSFDEKDDINETTIENKPKPNENKLQNDNKTMKDRELHTKSFNLGNDIVHVLRQNYFDDTKSSNKQDRGITNLYESKNFEKYKVFEIPATQSPFIEQKAKSKSEVKTYKFDKAQETREQPYYVPIYNYSPNNAFYNPHNRYEPNPENGNEQDVINEESNTKMIERDYYLSDDDIFRKVIEIIKQKNDIQSHKNNLDSINVKSKRYMKPRCDFTKPPPIKSESAEEGEGDKNSSAEGTDLPNRARQIRQLLLEKKIFYIPPDNTLLPKLEKAAAEALEKESQSDKRYLRNRNSDKVSNAERSLNLDLSTDDYNGPSLPYFDALRSGNQHRDDRRNPKKDPHSNNFRISFDDFYNNLMKYDTYLQPEHVQIKTLRARKGEDKENVLKRFVKRIRNAVGEKFVGPVVSKLKDLNLLKVTIDRTLEENEIETYLAVIEDMVQNESKALLQFDWLGTTVDLLSGIKKMKDMSEAALKNDYIHPSDLELLKYLVYLHNNAKEEVNELANELRNSKSALPRHKKKMVKDKGLLNRVWLMRMLKNPLTEVQLNEFVEFLDDLNTSLYDLCTAMKNIAQVTKYTSQNWFRNLKRIFIDDRKQYMEVLVHIFTSRILELVEESAKNGLEDNFLAYAEKNLEEVERTEEEFVFLLTLLAELKK